MWKKSLPCWVPSPSSPLPTKSLAGARNSEVGEGRTPATRMEGERRRTVGRIPRSAILILVVVAAMAVTASSIDDKCAACNAVAAEIELGLNREKPRNHLDMRHRLDSKGKREGKVIDYNASELRVVELLDGLCDRMQDYTLEKLRSGKKEWVKVKDWDTLKTDKRKAKTHAKDISTFCGRLLEDTEDEELSERIKQGSVQIGSVSKVLCQDLSMQCSQPRSSSDAGDDGEL